MQTELPQSLAPPQECPHCGSTVELEGAFPYCPNFDCSWRVYGRLQKFTDVLDIKGAGEETLKGLAFKGMCKTASDLFDVSGEQFCKLDRKGLKQHKKFFEGLRAKREMATPKFFAGLDIEGEGTWENICKVPGLRDVSSILEAMINGSLKTLMATAVRVSKERADHIVCQMTERMSEIQSLLREVKIKKRGDSLVGKTFCITGTLSSPRTQIVEKIKDAGGAVGSSVTSRTTHLVCNDLQSTKSKAKKAKALGVPQITEDQLWAMFGGN